MDFIRAQAQDRCGPCAAAVAVRDHLAFVDYRDIIMRFEVRHLHGGGLYPAVRYADLFFAGHQGTGNIRHVQRFKLLGSQEAQRSEIDPAARPAQAFHAFVGLAGIGGTQMQDKAAVHAPGRGIQVPVVFRDCVQQRRAELPLLREGFVRLLLEAGQ